jgi:ADP-dependent NAD(P)H-hydrate dehydratase
MNKSTIFAPARPVNPALLRGWPLPMPSAEGDKEERGHVLVLGGSREMPGAVILAATAALRAGAGKLTIATGASVAQLVALAIPEARVLGGSREMPGAVILAATAALRAGAGKLTIATGASVAQLVALAIPEARVLGLRETEAGGFTPDAVGPLDPLADKVNAILVGPGMQDEAATAALVHALLPRLEGSNTSIVLDACAMGTILHPPVGQQAPFCFRQPVIVTPHAGEMAHLTGASKDEIVANPDDFALDAARRWNAVVALKGARTVVAAPGGERWEHQGGNVGLAISGSGDTLAGIIAGLAARGATLPQAACWGVFLHAQAGERLAARLGVLGYLAREIPAEVPALLEQAAGDGAGHDCQAAGRGQGPA